MGDGELLYQHHPGLATHREGPSPLPGLLAVDWTRTGWPATMEAAVRSGYLATGQLLGRRLVRPDLA
jgi:hypothetical protein